MVANTIVTIEAIFSSWTRESFGYAAQRLLATATTTADRSAIIVHTSVKALTVLVYKAT